MAGAGAGAGAGWTGRRPSAALLLLLCALLCSSLLLLVPPEAAGQAEEDQEGETTERRSWLPVASWAGGRRALPRAAGSGSTRRPGGRWNSAGLRDSKHEVPSGPNPDSNR
ncbi:hypothetical protein U9M48_021535 [Paspalum notatum var. saurae]|uniref:Uncharacterized protein n=1 Tax=Paspalum notatum var. saurae TaxID=547442 RepID=A0AAQ3TJU8_PASNO